MILRDGARIHRLNEAEIVRISAADDFCEVLLEGGRTLLVSSTLRALEGSLPPRFVRIHKSHVVNLRHVVGVAPRTSGGQQALLADGSSLPLGRTYQREVRARIALTGDPATSPPPSTRPEGRTSADPPGATRHRESSG